MTQSPRSALLAIAATLVLLGTAGCARQDPTQRKPANVVLIVLDTLRADHLGAYGSELGLSPSLDRLASSAVVFDNAVAPSSWTRPSIASMLTALYPTSLRLVDRKDALAANHQTLAEILKSELGFTTLGVSTSPNSGAEFGFDQGYDAYVRSTLSGSYWNDREIPIAEGVNAEGLRLLDEHDLAPGFFLFLHYLDPHAPYLPHPELEIERTLGPMPEGRYNGSRRRLDVMDRRRTRLTDADKNRIRYLYAGEVAYLDHWLGNLFGELESRGLWDETMIVVTSDHGEGLWDHDLRDHGNDLYEETVHVPLIIRYPEMNEGDGWRIETPVSLVDITPTILASFRLEPPGTSQGIDLATLGRSGEQGAPALVLSEMEKRGRQLRSIRRGDLKLIEAGEPPCERDVTIELFDLALDPNERTNVAGQRGAVEARLATALARSKQQLLEGGGDAESVELSDLDPATLDSLRALGYLSAGEHRAAIAGRASPATTKSATAVPEHLDRASLSSAIDFRRRKEANAQILYGFKLSGREARPACRQSSVVLGRHDAHAVWEVHGDTRALAPSEVVSLTVEIDGVEGGSLTTETEGSFVMTGQLLDDPERPPGSAVELTIRCSKSGAPRAALGKRNPYCVNIERIALR